MSGQPLVDVESEIGPLLTTLKRFDEASAKELKKGINQLGTQGKRLLQQNTPVHTGKAKGAWSKSNSVTTKKGVQIFVKINWKHGGARYPFILEHGRHAGVSKSGRRVTYMAPRKYIEHTRQELQPIALRELGKIRDEAIRAFGA